MNKWYRLDNAAKVFPSVTSRRRSNIFRLSITLKEEVDPNILQTALEETINRFPSFKVKLKRGFFWFYFEENGEIPKVSEETPYVCEKLNFRAQQRYLFRLTYYHQRISLEIFHALTDGSGAMEFLKAIVYKYLLLKGKPVKPEKIILTDIETR
ncbi:MAG TPA: MFS transporter, partial [Bacilli bacterium]|nr:MFS transporter [Bacilli bacterium]